MLGTFVYCIVDGNVKNFLNTVSMVVLDINRNSSNNSTLQRLPLAESLAVTTLINDEFLNTNLASVPLILLCFSSISNRSSADKGFNSYIIFSRTFKACPLVPDAMQIFVPGYKTPRVAQ